MASSAAAAKDDEGKAVGDQIVSKLEELMDSITVANGKAKVKHQAKSTGKKKVQIAVNGESLTFTARRISKQINNGVDRGNWRITESAGELSVDLTDKGRRRFFTSVQTHGQQGGALNHCDGKKGIYGDSIMLDDDAVDSIQWGAILSGGVFTIAAAIAGAIAATAMLPIVLAAAAVLATVSAGYIALTNEGCGIEVETDSETVSSQHCDC